MDIHVQFSDKKGTEIVSVFSCEQDKTIYPNMGVVDSEDIRYLQFVDKLDEISKRGMPHVEVKQGDS